MIDQNRRVATFNGVVPNDERFRIGYSNELFEALATLGFVRGANILDVGCGTGISVQPLLARGMKVTGLDASAEMLAAAQARVPDATLVNGRAEDLPFAAATFDGVVCAQAFHSFDADRAYAEFIRVVKPGAPVAVWWKVLGSEDPMRSLRSAACMQAGVEPAGDALQGGFNAFYRAPFAGRTLRVLAFNARYSIDDWIGYERSRTAVQGAYGNRAEAYVAALRGNLIAKYGSPQARVDVRYTQYLYVGTGPRP